MKKYIVIANVLNVKNVVAEFETKEAAKEVAQFYSAMSRIKRSGIQYSVAQII